VSAGVGGWLTERTALTGRAFGSVSSNEDNRWYVVFVGPTLQYWINRQLWIGYGAGFGQLSERELVGAKSHADHRGVALDLRIGDAFTLAPRQTIYVSLELSAAVLPAESATPSGTPDDLTSSTSAYVVVALGVGYQYQ
jgi:hypothetical protein